MTVAYEKPMMTKEEVRALSEAGDALYREGRTNIVCPRCGSAIILGDMPYPVRCSDPGCIKLTARGL